MLNIPEYESASKVFRFFEEITKIPHTSENTAEIADYLVNFAKERGLQYERDAANNVIIKKAATRGYEDRPAIILQGHTDMVADKLPDADIDMLCDGLRIYRDGDFIKAKGTTLGADDGIAVAYALAILDSDSIEHPEFEAVFTSDEEIGLIGASKLDTSVLRGKRMLNIDSDIEGIFTVGCAGGIRLDIALPYEKSGNETNLYSLTLSGLHGGHSGMEINKGYENAIKILTEILAEATGLRIASISGGNADNAIPRFAECIIALDSVDYLSEKIIPGILEKYKSAEPDMTVKLEPVSEHMSAFCESDSKKILEVIDKMPTGVYKMSEDIEGLVETSSNLGIINTDGGRVSLSVSVRSSKNAEKQKMIQKIKAICDGYNGAFGGRGEYPAWEYKKDSPLTDTVAKIYRETYSKEPKIEIIHAGLECGIFADKIDGLDCVSFGPDMFDIHTTDERLSISSTVRVWEFLKKVLKEI